MSNSSKELEYIENSISNDSSKEDLYDKEDNLQAQDNLYLEKKKSHFAERPTPTIFFTIEITEQSQKSFISPQKNLKKLEIDFSRNKKEIKKIGAANIKVLIKNSKRILDKLIAFRKKKNKKKTEQACLLIINKKVLVSDEESSSKNSAYQICKENKNSLSNILMNSPKRQSPNLHKISSNSFKKKNRGGAIVQHEIEDFSENLLVLKEKDLNSSY